MKVLIMGSGGREHALGWKIKQSPLLTDLFFVPGNPGTAELGQNVALDGDDALVDFAREHRLDLVVVGPELPLVNGIADRLAEVGVPCFGPSAAAARLEGSKAFAKEVMDATSIPTAAYQTFTELDPALAYVAEQNLPIVVKADGLAGGKGVTICQTEQEAGEALREALEGGRFGDAGRTVVVEEFLTGTEASVHLICDGERIVPLITAQDHKTLYEDGKGPNTGGMGTFAPSPMVTPELMTRIEEEIAAPVMKHMNDQGQPFRGVLFAGLMLTWNGPKVLEFNVRFGDPETQVLLPLLESDLLPILHQAATGNLRTEPALKWRGGHAVCVVLAADGYPRSPRKGDKITGVGAYEQGVVFQAGTKRDGHGGLVTNGGRVLGLTAWDQSLQSARTRAYQLVDKIDFAGKHYRRDIGGASR
ncbi:phosphoribosylamine--glycine ligase [Acanthopleuribacter pedis]|uniref:Phosphoribosylamine--glycine ligase n=1 Tax=Acanthopleuribacter pedis TaxID=442870 RepID=A0A8J7U5I4_9BACT|nr:phosphoribosylamine--glycine ligase [Acanthopleuribacter pedis]MBO1321752.1 phosphoribosylamine--glycine ligase [Acanthopleuribacter pedis]